MPKKLGVVVGMVLLCGLLGAVPALAGGIGFVDFELLFVSHPEYAIKSQEYQEVIQEYVEEYEAKAAGATSEEDLQQLITYYDAKVAEKDEELSGFIIESVKIYIIQVAQANDIDVVLAKNAVLYGGIDLTKLVLEEMYRAYGISVPSYLR